MGTSYIEKSDSSNHMECISNNTHFYRLEWSTNPGVFPINKTCGIHCCISLISLTKKKKEKKKETWIAKDAFFVSKQEVCLQL